MRLHLGALRALGVACRDPGFDAVRVDAGGAHSGSLAGEQSATGDQPSPVTLIPAPGSAPSRETILAEADADPVGSTAAPGVPTDFRDQIGETRRLLRWLIGVSDEIPVDGDDRGELVGARGGYARTDEEIRQVLGYALAGLRACDLPEPMDPADAMRPGRWESRARRTSCNGSPAPTTRWSRSR